MNDRDSCRDNPDYFSVQFEADPPVQDLINVFQGEKGEKGADGAQLTWSSDNW